MYLAVLRLRQALRKSDGRQFCETIMIRCYDKYWSKDGADLSHKIVWLNESFIST